MHLLGYLVGIVQSVRSVLLVSQYLKFIKSTDKNENKKYFFAITHHAVPTTGIVWVIFLC